MKTKIFVVVVLLIFVRQVAGGTLGISDVTILPNQPSNNDIITISVAGGAVNSGSSVLSSEFSQNGLFLQLDLRVTAGILTMPSCWAYSTEIEPLYPGTYTLEVRAFDYGYYGSPWYGTVQDVHTVDFTVIPEPATLLLLIFGTMGQRLLWRKPCGPSVR